jgi:hypothetical protein
MRCLPSNAFVDNADTGGRVTSVVDLPVLPLLPSADDINIVSIIVVESQNDDG